MNSTSANLLLLATGAVWGMGFVAQQSAMEDMPAMLFVGLRLLLAALTVLPFAIREHQRSAERISWRSLGQFTVLGTVFFFAMGCQQIGLLGTTVTNAGFLTALYVILVPIITFAVFGQQQAPAIWIAAASSLCGIFLLSGGDLQRITWGDWLVVLCAVFWAIHVILVDRFTSDSERPITMATAQFFVCGVLGMLAHAACSFAGFTPLSISSELLLAALPEILYAGILSGGLAFTIQMVAQKYTQPSIAAILMGTESLFAAVFGALLLGDRLTRIGYVGCALIFASVLLVELFPKTRQA